MTASEPGFLAEPNLRLVLFGGKGGVGKTTCAVSAALRHAREAPGSPSLLVSTDPAHSLVDALDGAPLPPSLTLLEFDAAAALDRFRTSNDAWLRDVAARGTLLEDREIDDLLNVSLPGLDELMAFLEIASWLEEGRYSRITVDTAQTGHTLRLIATPGLLRSWLAALDALLAKDRYMRKVFSGAVRRNEVDEFAETLEASVARAEGVLQDPERCRFVPVTLAEPVCTAETLDLLDALRKARVPVREIVVNRLRPEGGCRWTASERRKQRSELAPIAKTAHTRHLRLWGLPALNSEPRGAAALATFWDAARPLELETEDFRAETAANEARGEEGEDPLVVEGSFALPAPSVELILFAGKGGVGKTTLACAAAMALAPLRPDRPTLLLSADPAHSLADALGFKVGDRPVAVTEHLSALELDANRRLERLKKGYEKDIERLLSTIFQKLDPVFERLVLERLLDLAPPGIDEVMALAEMASLLSQRQYGLIVLDTAPTGHLIRLLEAPELVAQWLKVSFGFLLRFREVIHLPRTVKSLVELSRGIKQFRELVSDPNRTALYVVTVPTAVALAETRDLLDACHRLEVPVGGIAVNQGTPPCDCVACSAARGAEAAVTGSLRESAHGMPLATVSRGDFVRGPAPLERLGRLLFPVEDRP